MKRRVFYGFAILLLTMLLTVQVWQGSFSVGQYAPSPDQTLVLWAVSLLIFLLTVTLAFMLIRTAVKLSVERHQNREGSRLKTKLVVGAVILTAVPVFFQFFYSYSVLNRSLDKWFSWPAEGIKDSLIDIGNALSRGEEEEVAAEAKYLSLLPEIHNFLTNPNAVMLPRICQESGLERVEVRRPDGGKAPVCVQPPETEVRGNPTLTKEVPLTAGGVKGALILTSRLAADLAAKKERIDYYVAQYNDLQKSRKETRNSALRVLVLITLFTLFVATWIALFLARQISVPISALLAAARQVRSGNLAHRVEVGANDEIASLVRAFNEMTHDLETNSRELEQRRLFTETILESIPTGVISLSGDGRILRCNRALKQIFPEDQLARATKLLDLFNAEDTAEIRYLINRARRTGVASREMELRTEQQVLQLSVTVSALADRNSSVFVLVLEDTSELLRAQKAAAWHEVARRVAHEIKNPLTPISLCAERIVRQLNKPVSEDQQRILRECATTISQEVESVRTLVDEFSQFSRFPAAQLAPADLNEVIDVALQVFQGRLEGIELDLDLAAGLPTVMIDREQFKRVMVNLVDNAAEAMQQSLVRKLLVATRPAGPDMIEILVADTGCGVSPEDKEKLFLPYFSTKGRGTGLGLAIVSRILADHHAMIRVEENRPSGARFVIELPVMTGTEVEPALEVRA